MSTPLYKHLGKRSPKVVRIGSASLQYEASAPKEWWEHSVPLVSDDFEIGIEIEVENVQAHACTAYTVWSVHNDGSLRNSGYEYVTAPINGKRIPFALNQFFRCMSPDIQFSPRTSIHIHLNVLDLTPVQIAGLLTTYMVVEPLLYRFVGGNRDKNNFCVPLNEAAWNDLIKRFTSETFSVPEMPNHRYLGVNIDAVRKFGTLEFRHLGGTSDVNKIMKWIGLIMSLKTFAIAHPFEAIRDRIVRLNSNSLYSMFINDVFPYPWHTYLSSASFQQDMEEPVSRVKRLTVKNDFLISLKKQLSNKSEFVLRFKRKKEISTFTFGTAQTKQSKRRNQPVTAGRMFAAEFARPADISSVTIPEFDAEPYITEEELDDIEARQRMRRQSEQAIDAIVGRRR